MFTCSSYVGLLLMIVESIYIFLLFSFYRKKPQKQQTTCINRTLTSTFMCRRRSSVASTLKVKTPQQEKSKTGIRRRMTTHFTPLKTERVFCEKHLDGVATMAHSRATCQSEADNTTRGDELQEAAILRTPKIGKKTWKRPSGVGLQPHSSSPVDGGNRDMLPHLNQSLNLHQFCPTQASAAASLPPQSLEMPCLMP